MIRPYKLPEWKVHELADCRKGIWSAALLNAIITNKEIARQGNPCRAIKKYVKNKDPSCIERYVRWCERSAGQIIVSLLLDYVCYLSLEEQNQCHRDIDHRGKGHRDEGALSQIHGGEACSTGHDNHDGGDW